MVPLFVPNLDLPMRSPFYASKVTGKKLIVPVCNIAVKMWHEVRREAHARYISSKVTTGWAEYALEKKSKIW